MADKVFPTDIPTKLDPVDADLLLIADTEDNSELKKVTIWSITADIADWIINDASASTTTTYSSDKINTLNGAQDTTISGNYTTLNNAKLNKAAQLRTGNGAWKTTYNDASGNEVELSLWAAWTVLNSNGATSAPTWVAPSVNISGTTEDTAWDMAADFLLAYDTSAGANRKQKPQVYSSDNATAAAKTSTTKWLTPANLAVIAPNNQKFQSYAVSALPTSFAVAHWLGIAPSFVKVTTTNDLSGYVMEISRWMYKSWAYSTQYVSTVSWNPPQYNSWFATTTSTISQYSVDHTANANDYAYTMTISSIDTTNINFAITRTLWWGTMWNILFAIEYAI